MVTLETFDAVFREYIARCPHTLDEIVNKKMYFILRAAWEGTPQVQRSTIEQNLSIDAYKIRKSRKTGKFSRGAAVHGSGSVVFRIINARRKRAGLKGLYGKDMAKAVRRLTGARLRAAGTLRRGWLRSLLTFAAKAKEAMVSASDGKMPAGRGAPVAAEPGWAPIAATSYEVNIESTKDARIDPRVEQALAAAFAREQASMQDYIERKIQEEIDRLGAGN
jgi:hypothetical protein